MDKEKRVLPDNRQGRLSQKLRAAQSVCGRPSNPAFSLPPSVPPYCCPASIPAPSEGWGWECTTKLAFVPFMKTTNNLFGLDQQGRKKWRKASQSLKSQSGWGGESGWTSKQHFCIPIKAVNTHRYHSATWSCISLTLIPNWFKCIFLSWSFFEVALSLSLETSQSQSERNLSCQFWSFRQYQMVYGLKLRYVWSQMADIFYYLVI